MAGREEAWRRRITLKVGQSLELGGIKITFLRDNGPESILLDVNGPPSKVDRSRERRKPLRRPRSVT
jgi:hypothetical protein